MEVFRQKRLIQTILEISTESNIEKVLEIGPGLNPVCHELDSWEVTFLEPMDFFFHNLTQRLSSNSRFNIFQCSLEDVKSVKLNNQFDLIVMSSVLHELANVDTALQNLIELLSSEGRIIIVVPNQNSIHRYALLNLNALSELGETEIKMQQLRSFSPESLSHFMESRGFKTIRVLTSFLKPFHHAKMQELCDQGVLTDRSLNQLYEISSSFHPYCSEIFWVGKSA